ncbi:MAG TPA: hypothetical protein VGR35_05725 [Tepidisphaeraceae bacterium]|nr:hypothetical protein [Tepidisphaeraceae bacterium]
MLHEYRDILGEMKAELQKPDHRVDVDALNRADAAARWIALDYWKLHYPKG